MVVACVWGGTAEGSVLPRLDSVQKHWFRLESSAPLVERNGGYSLAIASMGVWGEVGLSLIHI